MQRKASPPLTVIVEMPATRGYKRPKAAAEFLGIHVSGFWKLVRAGEFATIKLAPRITVVPVDALDAFVARKAATQQEVA
ncbi:hypothetical protein AWB68_05698 [Caballeronia choica]|uniref:Helix-turn-helix domain-containing protein n=1 Tax=Caballeronia choica TaxID=326476 RepID=A0A158KEZ9_9BURK|nr:helix-turn-helix domain-containing protein [Caballeronia choica]SAL79718.1 hypothetical protein AWB68_05698 [Caballeronia choica]